MASFGFVGIAIASRKYPPLNCVFYILIVEIPDMFTQFCGVLVLRVSKRTGVVVISRLKLALCMSYVSFLLVCVISGNCCLVNHVCC